MSTASVRFFVFILCTMVGCLALSACGSVDMSLAQEPTSTQYKEGAQLAHAKPLTSQEELALAEEVLNPVYRLGSGDIVRVDVVSRPEVSGRHTIGPDGIITLPVAGDVNVKELTRDAARRRVQETLKPYYVSPHVSLGIEDYSSNFITVLGRVGSPGLQKFTHQPTLIEAIAGAGSMPLLDKQSILSRCAIMRGRDKVIWVNLTELLSGNANYNLRLKRGDIVYIPDTAEVSVHVLGQVARPGTYKITPRMKLLDALAQAGGTNEDAQTGKIALYRSADKTVKVFDLEELMNPSRTANFKLQDGDVLFVPRRGLAEVGYYVRQIFPGVSILKML